MNNVAIEAKRLTKSFGDTTAVDGISFEVESGEIFGLLGPNGAGKSTTMMIFTTLLSPTSGEAFVGGVSVADNPMGVRQRMGYIQQDIAVDEYMTGRENLHLHARLSHMPMDASESRIDEMLRLVELEDRQHDHVVGYSGGMRKRLDIASGLLHMPDVLFLDEPTVGLDIQTRRKIWEYIRSIHSEYGITVFLTTHYMEEADNLCDRVAIIDHGAISAIDSPSDMKNALGSEMIRLVTRGDGRALASRMQEMEGVLSSVRYDPEERAITTVASNGTEAVPRIFDVASGCGATIDSINVTRPTLDDVFLHHTGHEMRDDDDNGGFNLRREAASKRRRGA